MLLNKYYIESNDQRNYLLIKTITNSYLLFYLFINIQQYNNIV